MNKKVIARAFNLWMDKYINHPEQFSHDFETVVKHLEEKQSGKPLSYGERSAAYLEKLMKEVEEKTQ